MTTFTGTGTSESISGSFVSPSVTTDGGPFPTIAADVMYGGGGRDTLDGNGDQFSAGDALYGGAGNDMIFAQSFDDSLYGGTGTDLLRLDFLGAAITINLATGVTNLGTMVATGFEDILSIGDFADDITGTVGNNFINSGDGNDTIRFSGGNDTVFAGGGDDLVIASSGVNVLDGEAGIDTVDFTTLAIDLVFDMATGLTNFAGESIVGFENVIVGGGNDSLIGTLDGNQIAAGAGDETVSGLGGFDEVYGGDGNDLIVWVDGGVFYGGDGTDTLDLSLITTASKSISIRALWPLPWQKVLKMRWVARAATPSTARLATT